MRFKARFEASEQGFDARITATDQSFAPSFEAYTKKLPTYAGPYEVTPKLEAQTLPTAQKIMTDDVQVKQIPVYKVSNTAGGSTIYIAKEV